MRRRYSRRVFWWGVVCYTILALVALTIIGGIALLIAVAV